MSNGERFYTEGRFGDGDLTKCLDKRLENAGGSRLSDWVEVSEHPGLEGGDPFPLGDGIRGFTCTASPTRTTRTVGDAWHGR